MTTSEGVAMTTSMGLLLLAGFANIAISIVALLMAWMNRQTARDLHEEAAILDAMLKAVVERSQNVATLKAMVERNEKTRR